MNRRPAAAIIMVMKAAHNENRPQGSRVDDSSMPGAPAVQHSRQPVADIPCGLQIGASPLSIYREYAGLPVLEPYVICAWTLEIRDGDGQHRQRVLPDGCSDIVWIGAARPIVVGPMTRSVPFTTDSGRTVIGMRFHPGAAASVFGVPTHELADRQVPLDELWSRRLVDDVLERLQRQRTTGERVVVARRFVAARCSAIPPPDPAVQHAISLLTAARPEAVEGLAKHLGISQRHLRRRFINSVGYGPKMFHRIVRFQKLLALANVPGCARLDNLALDANYADQAHMTREVTQFGGVPPSSLLGRVASALTLSDML